MATQLATPSTFLICCTADDSGTMVLLAQRQLIQKLANGQPARGIIPAWAGQWGLITGRPPETQPVGQTALAALHAQTGINLADLAIARHYGVQGTQTKNLLDKDQNPVPVYFVAFTAEGLTSLSTDIQANLAAQNVHDGVLQSVGIKSLTEATNLIGPVLPPPEGWKSYLVKNYYGGKSPNQFNLGFNPLIKEITQRSADPATGFRVAIENTPETKTPAPPAQAPAPAPARLVELKVTGAQLSPGGKWYQFYSPGQSIHIQAITEPANSETQSKITWQGGTPSPFGHNAQRTVALDNISPFMTSQTIQATLGDQSMSVKVAVLPDLVSLDISGAYSKSGGQWALNAQKTGRPAVVLAVVRPNTPEAHNYLRWTGGDIDPQHPDRRFVTVDNVLKAGTNLPVEVELMLE